jgi:DNA-binding HxlR family transcriptional regulator
MESATFDGAAQQDRTRPNKTQQDLTWPNKPQPLVMDPKELKMTDKIKYVQDTLYVISGKWKLPILMSMYDDTSRFRDLQRSIPAITTRVLSKELKDLEANKLIIRTVHDTYPVSITYTLTPYSFTLTPVVDEMVKWGERHRRKITRMKNGC